MTFNTASMALCELCKTISLSGIPSITEPNVGGYIASNRNMPRLHWVDEADNYPECYGSAKAPDDPLGFRWHADLDALALSAADCALCALAQKGVETWIGHYHDELRTNKFWNEWEERREPIPHGQQLWLVRRFNGGDGFTVLVRGHGASKKCVFPLTGISLSVDDSHAQASKMLSRPIQADSGSGPSLAVATAWVRDCVENHKMCLAGETPLPSRVLDVGSVGDTIRLVEDVGSGRYASLSHCWGSSATFTTTTAAYGARTSGFSIASLPKTFADAVAVTRHLGLRYLWIDSLCIVQDDQNDWARESGRMTDVYSNAYIVISANHGKDSSAGCFHSRKLPPTSVLSLPEVGEVHARVVSPGDEWSTRVFRFESEPLTLRGWALQERVLAGRILHFSSRQMFFECKEGMVGEDGVRSSERLCDLEQILRSKPEGPKSGTPPHDLWNLLVAMYGQRKLTKKTDMLPAMSGLARLFEQHLGFTYVAGLWSDVFLEGLSWQGLGDRQPLSRDEYIAPTWSWASYGGIGSGEFEPRCRDIAEVEAWHAEPQNEENPYGAVKNAWVRIRGPIVPLTLSEKAQTDDEVRLKRAGVFPRPRFCTQYTKDEEGHMVTLDHYTLSSPPSDEWRKWNMHVMILRGYVRKSKDSPKVAVEESVQGGGENAEGSHEHDDQESGSDEYSSCYGLVVTEALPNAKVDVAAPANTEKVMMRVGWMNLEGEEQRSIRMNKTHWETVTLV